MLLRSLLAIFLSVTLIPAPSYAQEEETGAEGESEVSEPAPVRKKGRLKGRTKAKVKKRRPARRATTQFRYGGALWQENIDLKTSSAESRMVAQSLGLMVDIGRNVPFRASKWAFNYSAGGGLGTIKGKGNNSDVPDELKNQLWFLVGFAGGFMYRTSVSSEIGFMFPVHYRLINWKLQSGTDLDVDKDSSFSAGAQFVYLTKLDKDSALHISITQQHMWQATMWGIAWQTEYR